MAQLTPQDDFIKTALRLPKEVHARVQESAARKGRSMNAEIVARLEESLASPLKIDLTVSENTTFKEVKAALEKAGAGIAPDQSLELTITTIKAG